MAEIKNNDISNKVTVILQSAQMWKWMKIWKSFSRVILKGYMKIVYGLFMKNIQAATDIGIIKQWTKMEHDKLLP